MKKKIAIGSGIIFIIFFGVLIFNLLLDIKEKKAIIKNINTIPEFSFVTTTGNSFTKRDLKKKIPIIFIYFNSECDFCQYETISIQENIILFENAQILFISPEPIQMIKSFSKISELDKYPNVLFLKDSKGLFPKQFEASSFPYILIYDSTQKLLKKQKGQLKAMTIAKILNNSNQ